MTDTARTAPLPSRFGRFIAERFPLTSHLPMALAFTMANVTAGRMARAGESDAATRIVAGVVAVLFLFRLRCFDELKDMKVDAVVHPERPLARGLVRAGEVHAAIAVAVVLEALLVAVFAPRAILAYAIALAFSLLMFREFFVGRFIRPHLTIYALMHTFVAALLGVAVAAIAQRATLRDFPPAFFLFGLVNWALFNVFEFARKTFVGAEERPDVETYSSLFKPIGAVALSASQVMVVLAVTWRIGGATTFQVQAALAALLVVSMAYYLAKRDLQAAGVYRAVAGVYIVAAYLGFAVAGV